MLSIIIPSFNDPRILRAIASVRRFDDTDSVQLVIVDGGSDKELIMRVREVLAPQDLLIWESDKGIFDALNKGLDNVAGNMIGWIGSDDVFHGDVKASEIIAALESSDICIAGTAMVDQGRIKRTFWLPRNPQKAAFLGLHNPHFSTFGRTDVLRRARFDIQSPIADIGYFLDVFASNPSVHVDRRIVTLQQVGGFSNSSLRNSFRYNALTYPLYRKHVSPAQAALASVIKVVPKVLSAIFYKLKATPVNSEHLSADFEAHGNTRKSRCWEKVLPDE
ncbi:MAG: glycosyltransferase [Cohaesibacteraceae bacterium]|nr:glycosyltransferase [Cohaesibacteraceae bacterium]